MRIQQQAAKDLKYTERKLADAETEISKYKDTVAQLNAQIKEAFKNQSALMAKKTQLELALKANSELLHSEELNVVPEVVVDETLQLEAELVAARRQLAQGKPIYPRVCQKQHCRWKIRRITSRKASS